MLRSLTRFIKNVVKSRIESIFAIASALLVLFTAMIDAHISFGIAGTLLFVLGICELVKKQKQERGYLND
jgi:hypothetical protein